MFWKCPKCGAIDCVDTVVDFGNYQDCKECEEVVQPHKFVATWDDFYTYNFSQISKKTDTE